MSASADPHALLHVAVTTELSACARDERYAPVAFAAEGFVHCCRPHQLAGVLSRYFRGRDDLELLTLDPALLAAPLREEAPPGSAERFPHVYGPLPWVAVIERSPLATDAAGGRIGETAAPL